MKTYASKAVLLAAASLLWSVSFADAQKGIGGHTGIAREPEKAEFATLKAVVTKVDTHPCENTTGPAPAGTHILARNKNSEELNIHLGPADKVREIAKQLAPGTRIKVRAFRTREMADHNYVAKTLTFGGKTVPLRDDRLRPFWAGDYSGRGFNPGTKGKGRRGRGR